MTKAELIELWHEGAGLSKAQAERSLEHLGDIFARELLAGGCVPLPGLGRLRPVDRAPRMGRNPRTGEAVPIPAQKAITFKPAKFMKYNLA